MNATAVGKPLGQTKVPKEKKPQVPPFNKIKAALGLAVMRNKITAEEMGELEEYIKKLVVVLS